MSLWQLYSLSATNALIRLIRPTSQHARGCIAQEQLAGTGHDMNLSYFQDEPQHKMHVFITFRGGSQSRVFWPSALDARNTVLPRLPLTSAVPGHMSDHDMIVLGVLGICDCVDGLLSQTFSGHLCRQNWGLDRESPVSGYSRQCQDIACSCIARTTSGRRRLSPCPSFASDRALGVCAGASCSLDSPCIHCSVKGPLRVLHNHGHGRLMLQVRPSRRASQTELALSINMHDQLVCLLCRQPDLTAKCTGRSLPAAAHADVCSGPLQQQAREQLRPTQPALRSCSQRGSGSGGKDVAATPAIARFGSLGSSKGFLRCDQQFCLASIPDCAEQHSQPALIPASGPQVKAPSAQGWLLLLASVCTASAFAACLLQDRACCNSGGSPHGSQPHPDCLFSSYAGAPHSIFTWLDESCPVCSIASGTGQTSTGISLLPGC